MLKNIFKENKGITLIALVVTIIVLLILAGISISMLTGQNGILNRTVEAKEKTEVADENEKVKLAIISAKIENNQITEDTLKKALDNQFGSGETTVENNQDGSYTVKMNNLGKREYTIEDDGSLMEGSYSKWDGTSATEPTEKTNNEIHIYTVSELKWLANQVNDEGNTFEGYTIYLENNLDLGARKENDNWETDANENVKWTAIGKTADNMLKGTFEGNNHIIKDMYVNDGTDFNGIFGNSNSIRNLTVKDSYVKGKTATAGIVGALRDGTIENCRNINTRVESVEAANAGGIVGVANNNTRVLNCNNSGKIINEKTYTYSTYGEYSQIGGIVGGAYNNCTVENCYNIGEVTGNGHMVGGIAGLLADYGNMQKCYNTGNIKGKGNSTGGLVGQNYASTTIENCYNTGNITGENYTGGIAGTAASVVTKCYNTGNVLGTSGITGGIVGGFVTKIPQDISLCYNSGKVEAPKQVGGISGYLGAQGYAGKEYKCYNKGEIICTTTSDEKGEIVGKMTNDATVSQCYFYTNDTSKYGVGAINNGGNLETQRTEKNINSFEEFINWIEQ